MSLYYMLNFSYMVKGVHNKKNISQPLDVVFPQEFPNLQPHNLSNTP